MGQQSVGFFFSETALQSEKKIISVLGNQLTALSINPTWYHNSGMTDILSLLYVRGLLKGY